MDHDQRRRKFESEQRIKAARAAGQCALAFHRISDLLGSLSESETPYSAAELETLDFHFGRGEEQAVFVDTFRNHLAICVSPPRPRSERDSAKRKNRCKGHNSRGQSCHAAAVRGHGFCQHHRSQAVTIPQMHSALRELVREGGPGISGGSNDANPGI